MVGQANRILSITSLISRLLLITHVSLALKETTSEVCNFEQFSARCPYGQNIIITKALYGHIKIGRCISIDLGHFGCSANVARIVEERCDGKQRCQISMPDEEIAATKTCAGLSTYLEASYACIPESLSRPGCNGVNVDRKEQYITSKQIWGLGCQTTQENDEAMLLFHGDENLNIKFKVEAVHTGKTHNESLPQMAGYIIDGKGVNISIPLLPLENEVVITDETAKLVLTSPGYLLLIGVQATGCVDFEPPPYTWVQRQGDVTTLGCHNNKHSWQIKCIGSRWLGATGNCTEPPVIITQAPKQIPDQRQDEVQEEQKMSREILYALIIGITLFLCTVTITTGYVCLKRSKYHIKAQQNMEMQAIVYDGSDSNSWTRHTNTKAGLQQQNNLQNTWQPTLVRQANGTNGTIAGTAKQYYILDQDYVNANGT